MKSPIIFIITFLFIQVAQAQVGIGRTTTTSMLDIATTNNGIPALCLTPQTNPIGSKEGHLAVIGDQLYVYDALRSKWLTQEMSTMSFGVNGTKSQATLEYSGDITAVGAVLPKNGIISGITVNSSGGGNNKVVQIKITPLTGSVRTHNVTLTNGKCNFQNLDYEFSKDDSIEISLTSAGSNISNPSVVLYTKRTIPTI